VRSSRSASRCSSEHPRHTSGTKGRRNDGLRKILGTLELIERIAELENEDELDTAELAELREVEEAGIAIGSTAKLSSVKIISRSTHKSLPRISAQSTRMRDGLRAVSTGSRLRTS